MPALMEARAKFERETPPAPFNLLHQSPLIAGGRTRHIREKEVVFSKGDRAAQAFLILDGRVKVSASSEDGKEIIFAILGAGELLGEIALIEGNEHSASVIAIEPTDLLALERKDFIRLIREDSDVALSLLTTVCSRLRGASELAEDLSFLPLPVRLAKRLIALAHTYGIASTRGIRIGLHLCQQELANMVSTTRESVNKQLAVWQGEGLISMRKGYLTVIDIPTFAARHHL
jgi:CRP/FNR family transcriptional regulator, cyclic AMP receptor protein